MMACLMGQMSPSLPFPGPELTVKMCTYEVWTGELHHQPRFHFPWMVLVSLPDNPYLQYRQEPEERMP